MQAILPSMVLWGFANALIQPTLFAAADAIPRADLTSGTAILAVARQLGSALGVAVLVIVLPAGFQYAWAMVLLSAAARFPTASRPPPTLRLKPTDVERSSRPEL